MEGPVDGAAEKATGLVISDTVVEPSTSHISPLSSVLQIFVNPIHFLVVVRQ